MVARQTEPALVADGVVRLGTELAHGVGDAMRRANETGQT